MYRKIKSNNQIMYTPTGELVNVSDHDYQTWLTQNNAPEETYPTRVQVILDELDLLDKKSIRPLLEGDTARIEQIKAEKAALKAELDSF